MLLLGPWFCLPGMHCERLVCCWNHWSLAMNGCCGIMVWKPVPKIGRTIYFKNNVSLLRSKKNGNSSTLPLARTIKLSLSLAFPGAHKTFRDARTRVRVEVVTSGEYPGDGLPKPVAFPDPDKLGVEVESAGASGRVARMGIALACYAWQGVAFTVGAERAKMSASDTAGGVS
jgi:hypothetical protein